jgi:hypothetical protein
MVWKKAISDTCSFYQTSKLSWIGSGVGIAVTLLFVYIFAGLGSLMEELALLQAGIMGFIGTGIFYILVHRMSAPLVLYRKKETEANLYTWEDVEIEPYNFLDSGMFGAAIKITSRKEIAFHYTHAKLAHVGKDGEKLMRGEEPILLPIAKDSGDKSFVEDGFGVYPDKPVYVAVANADTGSLWAETEKDKKDCREIGKGQGDYEVKILLDGRINPGVSCPLPIREFYGMLKYDGNKVELIEVKK